jgi:3-methyladenine DNA glycosylase AlkD
MHLGTSGFEFIEQVRQELKKNADDKTRLNSQKFFKEEITTYGVKSHLIHQISKELFKELATESKSSIFDICETLWKSGYFEDAIVACNWSYFLHKKFEQADFNVFEKWISRYVSNWATCDTFCNHTVGEFIEMFPEFLSGLKAFTRSDNRWMRRAAAVSLIVPARNGKFLADIFEIADLLLVDKDDMVQKGYGWMLKAASQAHQQAVFEYVVRNKAVMPRTALRYAIEKMPPEMKAIAMMK